MTTLTPSRAAASITAATAIDTLGWRLSLRTYRIAHWCGAVIALLGSAALTAIGVDLLRGLLNNGADAAAAITAMAINGYLLMAHSVRETLTTRRIQLTSHPWEDFFRALDVPRRAVIVAEAAPRFRMLAALVTGVCGAVALRVTDLPLGLLLCLVLTPLSCLAGAAAISLGIAAWSRARGRPRMLVAAASGCLAGAGVAALAGAIAPDTMSAGPATTPGLWNGIALTLIVALLALAGLIRAAWHALGGDVVARSTPLSPRRLVADRPASRWLWYALSDLAPPLRAATVARTLLLTWAAGSAAAGLTATVMHPRGWQLPEAMTDQLTAAASFFISIALAEVLTRWMGPAAYAARVRHAWESGAAATALAAAPLWVATAVVTATIAPIGIAAAAFGASAPVALAVAWSAIAATWIAAALVSLERPRADGTVALPLSAGILAVIITAASAVLALGAAAIHQDWIAPVLSLGALGGATWTSRRRILTLPSKPLA